MSDEQKFPTHEHWWRWTYEDALAALTNERVELRILTWTPTPMKKTPKTSGQNNKNDKNDKNDKDSQGDGNGGNGGNGGGQGGGGPGGDSVKPTKLENAQWFMWDPDALGHDLPWNPKGPNNRMVPQDLTYYFCDKQYFGANVDWNAVGAYEQAVADMSEFMTDFSMLQRGDLDGQTLVDLTIKVDLLMNFLLEYAGKFRKRADDLKGSDSSLRGKASALIQERLDWYADTLEDWRDQVVDNNGKSIASAATDASVALYTLVNGMVRTWSDLVHQGMPGLIRHWVNSFKNSINDYLDKKGLFAGTPNYVLNDMAKLKAVYGTPNKAGVPSGWDWDLSACYKYIDLVLDSYPLGSLRDPETWKKINSTISLFAWPCLTTLDQSARAALPGLRDSYVTLAEALVALVNPNPFTPHAGTGGPNNFPGGPNGFPNFNMNFPPFSFDFPNSLFPNSDFSNFNFPPSGGNFNYPPYDPNSFPYGGGPNLPADLGSNSLGDLFGGLNGLFDPLNGLFDPVSDMFNPLNGVFDPVGGMFNPLNGLFDPVSGMFGPLNGLFGPHGDVLNGMSPRDLLGANLPGLGPMGGGRVPGIDQPRVGPLGELLGANGKPTLGKHGELLDQNRLPLLGPHGELVGADGKPLRGPHGELLGADGKPLRHIPPGATATAGAGVPGLGGRGSGLPELPGGSSGLWQGGASGSPAPASGTPSAFDPSGGLAGGLGGLGGLGGMPYMPGMGGMGTGGDRKERERQTWLSEDEKVWGTDVAADVAVIGRPDDDEDDLETEEVVLPLGPVRALRPAPGREPPAGAAGTSDGEEDETISRQG